MTTCQMSQLDAIIAACGGCKPRPSKRQTVMTDEISPNLAAPGMQYQCDFTGVPMTDSLGRIAHVRGFTIETSVKLEIDTAQLAAPAVTSHQLRSLLTNIKLQGRKNHLYTENIDARDILDDSWGRNLRVINARPLAGDLEPVTVGELGYPVPDQISNGFGSKALALAGGVRTDIIDITTDFWFGTDAEGPLSGLIPLFELVTAVNGSLRFTFGASIPGGVASRVVDSYECPETSGSVAARVWLHLVYTDALVIDPVWKVDSYTVDRLKGTLKYPDQATRYAAVRNHEDEAALDLVDTLSAANLSLDIAGFSEISGLSADRMRSRLMELLADHSATEHMDFNRAVALPAFVPAATGTVFGPGNRERQIDLLVPFHGRRSLSPAGPVNYQFQSFQTAQTFQRVLHRTLDCQDTARVAEAARAAYGAASGMCGCTTVGDDGKPTAGMDATSTMVVTRARRR